MEALALLRSVAPTRPVPCVSPPHPDPTIETRRLQRGVALVGVTGLTLLGLGAALITGAHRPGSADPVSAWNRIAIDAGATLERGTSEQRALAMMHLAIHDALQSIRPIYAPYVRSRHAYPHASPDAAIAAAAHEVLVATIPMERDAIDVAYARAIERIPDGAPRNDGVRAGHEAARAILALRAHDGADRADVAYDGRPGVGAWEPTPPNHFKALLPGWRSVTPFAMQSPMQFRPAPPPALDSAEYARQYAAVKALGGQAHTRRTEAQGETARFWAGNVNEAWNEIARDTLALRKQRTRDGLATWRSARTFALLNMAMADGFVSGWDGKYTYRAWRPITAIHRGDADGNPATAPDAGWNAYLPTPEHPEYPSTHSVLSGAAATTLRCALGTDRTNIDLVSHGHYGGLVRHIASFDATADDIARSRVYAGAHFPFANAAGLREGRQIGALVCDRFLPPLGKR
jgi:hypothetical protein